MEIHRNMDKPKKDAKCETAMKELRENWIGDENQVQKEKEENPVVPEMQKPTAVPAETHAKLPPAVQTAMPAEPPTIILAGNCICFTCVKSHTNKLLPKLSMEESQYQEAQHKTLMGNGQNQTQKHP